MEIEKKKEDGEEKKNTYCICTWLDIMFHQVERPGAAISWTVDLSALI